MILRLCMLLLVCYCPTVLTAETTPIVEAPYQPDYAKGLPERHLWREVREDFMRAEYARILARHHLKLNCSNCTTVYADFEISISLIGKPKIRKVTVAKACAKPMSAKMLSEFSRFLKRYPYKPGLFGTTVSLRLGTGLKC